MKPQVHIIKIGGKLINDASSLTNFLSAFAQLEGDKILVHGGGRKATEMSALLGIETKMIDGRRITNRETLEVAVMVYAGLVNKNIVAQLQRLNIQSLGLCGADLDVIRSHKREVKDIDYGLVGDIDKVNGKALIELLNCGITPVLSPITHDGNGQLLNTNADTIAAQTSISLANDYEVTLTYCFEYLGVLYDIESPELTMSSINEGEFINMKTSGSINSGMIPKLSNGFDAIKGGTVSVDICGTDNLKSKEKATFLKL